MSQSQPHILIVTAVPAEKEAIQRGLKYATTIDVIATGVGTAAAATHTAIALSRKPYDLVISAGIGGGFADKAEVGSLVIANEIIAADLGAESAHGFLELEQMQLGTNRIQVPQAQVSKMAQFVEIYFPVRIGAILTVSTATGTAATTKQHSTQYPQAIAEAMEGFGVATAAKAFDVPVIEIRSISNLIGPRDRDAWQIEKALEILTLACSTFWEE